MILFVASNVLLVTCWSLILLGGLCFGGSRDVGVIEPIGHGICTVTLWILMVFYILLMFVDSWTHGEMN